jgi:hypothetical protein
MDGGRVDIKYRRVECTPPSDMRVIVDSNSGDGGWLRLYVDVCAYLPPSSVYGTLMRGNISFSPRRILARLVWVFSMAFDQPRGFVLDVARGLPMH